jgi:hypothetical protein
VNPPLGKVELYPPLIKWSKTFRFNFLALVFALSTFRKVEQLSQEWILAPPFLKVEINNIVIYYVTTCMAAKYID